MTVCKHGHRLALEIRRTTAPPVEWCKACGALFVPPSHPLAHSGDRIDARGWSVIWPTTIKVAGAVERFGRMLERKDR